MKVPRSALWFLRLSVLLPAFPCSISFAQEPAQASPQAVSSVPSATQKPSVPAVSSSPQRDSATPVAPELQTLPSALSDGTVPTLRELGTPSERAPEKPAERRWYGWQTLLSDGASVAIVAASNNAPALAVAGVSAYVVGGPVIHLAHGHETKAALSLGLHLVAPLGGALVGGLIGKAGENQYNKDKDIPPAVIGAVFGFFTGIGVASVIDVTALSWEDVPVSSRDAHLAKTTRDRITFTPYVVRERGGGSAGLVGCW